MRESEVIKYLVMRVREGEVIKYSVIEGEGG